MKYRITVPSKLTGIDRHTDLRFQNGICIIEADKDDETISYARSQTRWKVEEIEEEEEEVTLEPEAVAPERVNYQ